MSTNVDKHTDRTYNRDNTTFLDKLNHNLGFIPNYESLEEDQKVACASLITNPLLKKYCPWLDEQVQTFKKNRKPFTLIDGVPIYAGIEHRLAEQITIGISLFLGEPFQYTVQNNGRIAAILTPKKGKEHLQSGESKTHFDFHTDDCAFSERYRVRWIALYPVINEAHTRTAFVDIQDCVDKLPNHFRDILRQNRFDFKVPDSFGSREVWSLQKPILWQDEWTGELGVHMSPHKNLRVHNPNDDETMNALAYLRCLFDECAQWFDLQPGWGLIFDNNAGPHARQKIDGERKVIRNYIRPDLNDLRRTTKTNGYVFNPELFT